MRARIQYHQYHLVVPIKEDLKDKTIKEFTKFISQYLQQHFNNKFIEIIELSTSDGYELNPEDCVQDVIKDDEVLICLDEQLYLDREIKVYCDRDNAWLHVERKKQVKPKKRRASNVPLPILERRLSATAIPDQRKQSLGSNTVPFEPEELVVNGTAGQQQQQYVTKWAEVGYNTRNKLYVLLGVGTYTQLFLFTVDELRKNGFQEKRIGIIEDETGDWYTLAKFEKERPENFKKTEADAQSPVESVEEDEAIAAIGLHVKAEGDQMANAEEIIIRVTKEGLLTTDASEVVHLFGTKSGKLPKKKKHHFDELLNEVVLDEKNASIS
jgi:hypothetical protein